MKQCFRFDNRSTELLSLTRLVAWLLAGAASALGQSTVSGPYFGQKPPGKTPEIFAPGILSLSSRMEARITFSPDGNECFFTVPSDLTFSHVQIYTTRCVNNVWSPQVVAPFAQPGYSYAQPFFSPDGNKLYFISSNNSPMHIWTVERSAQGWGNPQVLSSVNSSAFEMDPCISADGRSLVFASTRPGGMGGADLYVSFSDGKGGWKTPVNLGPVINSKANDTDPCVSPDGKYLIYSSNRSGGCGHADLYVTIANGKDGWTDGWTTPVNLNQYCPDINTPDAYEWGASLSPDRHYLFFVRMTPKTQRCDVYWVENPFSEPAAAKLAEVTGPSGSARR